MRILLQRVTSGSVTVEGSITGQITQGLVLLVGFGKGDNESVLVPMAQKISTLRVFPGGEKDSHFHLSLLDIKGGALLVPQFTLYGDPKKGRRPDFFTALEPGVASPLFDQFVETFRRTGVTPVETGVFGAHMEVALVNDGPVTIMVEMEP